MSFKLYVEGGGDTNKALQTRCRQGFSEFIRNAGLEGRMPRIVACGGRRQAFQSFRTARERMKAAAVLLVDSEGPVQTANPWEHVRSREGDRWECPPGATEEHLHFMVQTMEAWFYADREALENFYGQHFRVAGLGAGTEVEKIAKAELFAGLKQATANCQKGRYSKGAHSFQILACLDPAKVRAASPWCDRFLSTLSG